MPESYLSKDTKCPYYRKDVQNKIVCEGIDEDGTIFAVTEKGSVKNEFV